MSTFRSNTGRGTASDAERLAKKKQNSNHYQDTVVAGIYPTLTKVSTLPETQASRDETDFLKHLNTSKPFVDKIIDYSRYDVMGWNPDVVQVAKFQSPDPTPENPNNRRTTYYHLTPADGADTGLLFRAAPNVNGRVPYGDDGNVLLADEPFGRWRLNRATREECDVLRSRTNFFIEADGELKPISRSLVHGEHTDTPYVFRQDVPGVIEFDPNVRQPVVAETERWIEKAQVVQMDDKFFAHRNLLGVLSFEGLNGESPASYPIMEVDPKNIAMKRAVYASQVCRWREMTKDERSQNRRNSTKAVPRGAGDECFLVKEAGVLAGKDNYFVEVVKNDDGEWVPTKSA